MVVFDRPVFIHDLLDIEDPEDKFFLADPLADGISAFCVHISISDFACCLVLRFISASLTYSGLVVGRLDQFLAGRLERILAGFP